MPHRVVAVVLGVVLGSGSSGGAEAQRRAALERPDRHERGAKGKEARDEDARHQSRENE